MTWMQFQPDLSPEEQEQRQQLQDQVRARNEEITARIKRLVADDLSFDQLETVHALLAHIANSGQPALVATWYEGITYGALGVRDLVVGEGPEVVVPDEPG